MVDTITIQVNFTMTGDYLFSEEIRSGQRNYMEYSPYNRGKKRKYRCFVGGIAPYGLYYNASLSYICIEFNPKLILGYVPSAIDVVNIKAKLEDFISNELKIPNRFIDSIVLNRIDYNIDYRISCEEERQIIYDLMDIASNVLGNVVKVQYENAISYNPKNGYIQLIVYDKEMERKIAVRYVDYISIDEVDEDFQGIIRTEVRVKNRKLNYYKNNKKWKIEKDLKNYLREDKKKYFFELKAEKIWFTEPFYRIDIALNLIRNNSELKDNMKNKLCEVLKSIRRNGYSKARDNYGYLKRANDIQKAIKKGYSSKYIEKLKHKKLSSEDFVTFKNYIDKIRQLGINPLTFSRNYELEKIENFARYKGDAEQCNNKKIKEV